MITVYASLFNLILKTDNVPAQWTIGKIKPVYKNKGDSLDPGNYRPITILNCLGKLFTAVLNNRLCKFLEDNNLLSENQAGFWKHHSTRDHIFTLYSLIELYTYIVVSSISLKLSTPYGAWVFGENFFLPMWMAIFYVYYRICMLTSNHV